jgi:putative pyruvate formate lyase activating enzyme
LRSAASSYGLFRRRALASAPAGFVLARRIGAGMSRDEVEQAAEEPLWTLHRRLMPDLRAAWARPSSPSAPEPESDDASLLDVKLALSEHLLGPCRLCWLRCPVDRRAGQVGRCGLGADLRPYRDFVHLGEELELIPTHAVYLAGCNYRCPYCSEWDHVDRPGQDPEVPHPRLARSIAARRRQGVRSLTFVGGLPDVNLPGVLRALVAAAEVDVPVVWNTNLSGTPEAHDLLEGLVDCYVADLKYGREECSQSGSAVQGALDVVHRNLLRVAGEAYTIVRHLVLPGHLECCTLPVLDWLAARLPGVRTNLMPHFQPPPGVAGTEWDQRPASGDLARARDYASRLPLDLEGPGPLPSAPKQATSAPEATSEPVAGFESRLRIDPQGRVVIEDLSPELAGLAEALGAADDPDVVARGRAAEPWLEPPTRSGRLGPDPDPAQG